MATITQFNFNAFHLGFRINLPGVLDEISFEIIKDEPSFLLFKRDEESYLYVKHYGSVVFCGFTRKEMVDLIFRMTNTQPVLDELFSEEYELHIKPNEPSSVEFNTIIVPEFTIDVLHLMMLNLSQSVALENYQDRTNNLLEQTREISNNLKTTGDIGIPRNRLRKFVGRTMVLKNRIAENLLIFETSDLAWSNEQLSHLDAELRNQLDVVNRHHGLQYTLDIVKENLDLYRNILEHKHSSTLEWIIIALILLEVADLIITKLF